MQVAIEGSSAKELRIVTEIRNPKGKKVAYAESLLEDATDQSDTVFMRFTVRRPELWSPETPLSILPTLLSMREITSQTVILHASVSVLWK